MNSNINNPIVWEDYKFNLRLRNENTNIDEIVQELQNVPYLSQFGAKVGIILSQRKGYCDLIVSVPSFDQGGPFGSAVNNFIENNTNKWFLNRYEIIDSLF